MQTSKTLVPVSLVVIQSPMETQKLVKLLRPRLHFSNFDSYQNLALKFFLYFELACSNHMKLSFGHTAMCPLSYWKHKEIKDLYTMPVSSKCVRRNFFQIIISALRQIRHTSKLIENSQTHPQID